MGFSPISALLGWKGYAAAGAAAAILSAGATWRVMEWRADAAKVAPLKAQIVYRDRVITKIQKADAITSDVGAQVAAAQVVTHTVYRDIIREVPAHVTPADDARCVVPVGFVRSYNASAAAAPALPDSAGRADDAPSGVPLSTVASTDAANLEIAHTLANQVSGWQAWYAKQSAQWVKP